MVVSVPPVAGTCVYHYLAWRAQHNKLRDCPVEAGAIKANVNGKSHGGQRSGTASIAAVEMAIVPSYYALERPVLR